jgi:thymidylate synthase (FAD)
MNHLMDLIYFVHQWTGPNDLKKYLLPECWKTNLVMTVNLRELRHIYKLRTSKRALREFQELAHALKDALPFEHKVLLSIGMKE